MQTNSSDSFESPLRGTLVTSDDNYVVASLSDMGRLENGILVIDLADIIPKYRVQEKEKQKDGQWYQDVEIFAGGATHSIGNIINEDGLVRLSMDGKGKVVAVLDASLFQDQVTKICTHRFKMEQGRLVALHPGK